MDYQDFIREAETDLGRVSELDLLPEPADMVRERAANLRRNNAQVRCARYCAKARRRSYSD